MRKTIMMCILLAGMATGAMAQTQKPQGEKTKITAEQRAERQTERLAKVVTLTEEQKQSLYEVHLATAKKMEAQRAQGKEAWKAVRQEKETQYKSILSEAQYQQYLEHKKQMRAQKQGRSDPKMHRNQHKTMEHRSNQ